MRQSVWMVPATWLDVAMVAVAAAAYFTGGTALLARIAGEPASIDAAAVAWRAALATVVAAALRASESRRGAVASTFAAVHEGIVVAVIVIVVDILFAPTASGSVLAARAALLLLGLPALAALTHWLARRGRAHSAT